MGRSDGGGPSGITARLGSVPLRALLLIALLVPVTGIVASSGQQMATRWGHRTASVDQQAAARSLGRAVDVRAAVAAEQTYATIVVLARQLGVEREAVAPDGRTYDAARLDAQDELDAAMAAYEIGAAGPAYTNLVVLRTHLEDGSATFDEVDAVFGDVQRAVDAHLQGLEARIERNADRRPLSSTARARLRAVRDTVEGFSHGSQRVAFALGVLVLPDGDESEDLAGLIRTTALADAAFDRAQRSLGPVAARSWAALEADPAAQRTEALMGEAVLVALGDVPRPELEPGAVVAVLADGLVWATRTIDVLQSVAADLEAAAAADVAADTRAVALTAAVAAVVIVVALLVAVWIGRALRRVAGDLEAAARSIEQGEFDLPPLAPGGSREMTAIVSAFNDMAATLVAVERHAVALAEEPGDPVLEEPLPGRTGRAMQTTLDTLQDSIHEAERHRAELQQLASHDGLTGLLNRRAAFEALERDLARATRDGSRLMALYVDLDGLKALNDTHGHGAGDDAIRRTADVLRSATRRGDVVARLGGDEFLVSGPVPEGNDGEDLTRSLAERVHRAITSAAVTVEDGSVIPLRASVGVALSSRASTVESLVRAADGALYSAKQGGRSRIAWSEP